MRADIKRRAAMVDFCLAQMRREAVAKREEKRGSGMLKETFQHVAVRRGRIPQGREYEFFDLDCNGCTAKGTAIRAASKQFEMRNELHPVIRIARVEIREIESFPVKGGEVVVDEDLKGSAQPAVATEAAEAADQEPEKEKAADGGAEDRLD